MMKRQVAWVLGGLALLGLGALAVFQRASSASGNSKSLTVDDVTGPKPGPTNVDSPPKMIPIPDGWRRVKSSAEVPRQALAAANSFLYTSAMGQFDDHGVWGLLKEYHHDDHVDGVLKWHPGVTVLVPQTVQA